MKKIFEDILDDLSAEDIQLSTVKKVVDNISVDSDNYDYILYIGRTLTNATDEKDLQYEIRMFLKTLERLKAKMDVLLEDYYTDGVLYCEDESYYERYRGKLTMATTEEDRKRMRSSVRYNGCYKIYFNFDGNVMNMLRFFYAIANDFNAWSCHNWVRIYNTDDNCELSGGTYMLIDKFNRNFTPHLYMSADRAEGIADVMLHNFWTLKPVLKVPSTRAKKIYIIEKVKKFANFVNKLLNNEKNLVF